MCISPCKILKLLQKEIVFLKLGMFGSSFIQCALKRNIVIRNRLKCNTISSECMNKISILRSSHPEVLLVKLAEQLY